jgi:hypothetical protein
VVFLDFFKKWWIFKTLISNWWYFAIFLTREHRKKMRQTHVGIGGEGRSVARRNGTPGWWKTKHIPPF